MSDTVRDIELSYPCEFCGAAVGQNCRRRSNGLPAGQLHSSRWEQGVADGRMPWQQEDDPRWGSVTQ